MIHKFVEKYFSVMSLESSPEKGGAGNLLGGHRQIMKKILSKCKQQQQLHLTFISISFKYEKSLAKL